MSDWITFFDSDHAIYVNARHKHVHAIITGDDPMKIALTEPGEAPVPVYDTTGPYTDPDARIDIRRLAVAKYRVDDRRRLAELFEQGRRRRVDHARRRARHRAGQRVIARRVRQARADLRRQLVAETERWSRVSAMVGRILNPEGQLS